MAQDCGHSNTRQKAYIDKTILKGKREAQNKLGKKWCRIVSHQQSQDIHFFAFVFSAT
jgi:hypothetical protein